MPRIYSMNFEVKTLPRFDKEIKRLAKKYPSFKTDFAQLLVEIRENPFSGISLGNQSYKIRMAIASKNKGKSGGARVVYYIHIVNATTYLMAIFGKSEKENIPERELLKLIQSIE